MRLVNLALLRGPAVLPGPKPGGQRHLLGPEAMPAWHSAAGSGALPGEVEVVLASWRAPLSLSVPPPPAWSARRGPLPVRSYPVSCWGEVWASPSSWWRLSGWFRGGCRRGHGGRRRGLLTAACLSRRASAPAPGAARGAVPAVRLPLDEQPADEGGAPALHHPPVGHLPGELCARSAARRPVGPFLRPCRLSHVKQETLLRSGLQLSFPPAGEHPGDGGKVVMRLV